MLFVPISQEKTIRFPCRRKGQETPAPRQVWSSRIRLNPYEAGIGRENGNRKTYGRRLLDALFETHRNLANLRYQSLEHSNGRCPGCDHITAGGVSCQPELYSCSGTRASCINTRCTARLSISSYRRGL